MYCRPLTPGACRLFLHSQLPEQKRIYIGELFYLLRYWLAGAVAGFALDAEEDGARLALAIFGFGLEFCGHFLGVHRVYPGVEVSGHK